MTHIKIIGVCLPIFSGITLLDMLNGMESNISLSVWRQENQKNWTR